MSKQLAAILFTVIFLLQHSSKYLVMADYQLNIKYITENLCKNRNLPQLHCKGKCYLMQKMQEEEKRQAQDANNLKPGIEFHLFYVSNAIDLSPLNSDLRVNNFSTYRVPGCISLPRSVFRPPIA